MNIHNDNTLNLLDYLFDQNINTANSATSQQPIQAQHQPPSPTPQTDAAQTKSPDSHRDCQNHSNANNSSHSEEDDELIEAQLKMMPSKERRQLRNKISARNFRNRRKEYMSSLESKMDECKSSKSQLELEVKWVRNMMEKLQAENDRLRLELVLCKQKINQQQGCVSDIVNLGNSAMDNIAYENRSSISILPPTNNLPILRPDPNFLPILTDTTAFPCDWDLNFTLSTITTTNTLPITTACTNTSSTTNITLGTPNSVLSTSLPSFNNNDIYLEHASVPDWNISNILSKGTETMTPSEKIDLMRAYPLLAPALMSIILSQTVTLATEDLLLGTNLCDLIQPDAHNKLLLTSEAVKWEKLQQQQQQEEEQQQLQNSVQETHAEANTDSKSRFRRENCPFNWIQKQFCGFVIHHVVAKYPRLEPKARKYLPICDKYKNTTPLPQIK